MSQIDSKFIEVVNIKTEIGISPSEYTENYKQVVYEKLKKKFENTCNKDGFVLKVHNNMKFLDYGKIEMDGKIILFSILVDLDMFIPKVGETYKAVVQRSFSSGATAIAYGLMNIFVSTKTTFTPNSVISIKLVSKDYKNKTLGFYGEYVNSI